MNSPKKDRNNVAKKPTFIIGSKLFELTNLSIIFGVCLLVYWLYNKPMVFLDIIPPVIFISIGVYIAVRIIVNRSAKGILLEILKLIQSVKLENEARLQNPPRVFYYLDKETTRTLYSQITKGQVEKQLETIQHTESKHSVSGSIFGIGGEIGKSGLEEIKKLFVNELSDEAKYNEVEVYLEKQHCVTTLLEKMDIQHPDYKQISHTIFGTKGYARIQAKFVVLDNKKLQYNIPFPSSTDSSIEKEISIKVITLRENYTSIGLNIFKKGEEVTITCFGTIVRWKDEENSIVIAPIAIY